MRKYLTAQITVDFLYTIAKQSGNINRAQTLKYASLCCTNGIQSMLQINKNGNFYKSHIHIVYPEQKDIFIISISICNRKNKSALVICNTDGC